MGKNHAIHKQEQEPGARVPVQEKPLVFNIIVRQLLPPLHPHPPLQVVLLVNVVPEEHGHVAYLNMIRRHVRNLASNLIVVIKMGIAMDV